MRHLGRHGPWLLQDQGQAARRDAHGTVGLPHATMALYNAWCDRVPVYVEFGNIRDVQMRRPGVEWNHTAQDVGILVRDYPALK